MRKILLFLFGVCGILLVLENASVAIESVSLVSATFTGSAPHPIPGEGDPPTVVLYRRGDLMRASFKFKNAATSPLNQVFLTITVTAPDNSNASQVTTSPFSIQANAEYVIGDILLWSIPSEPAVNGGIESGAYLPVVVLKNQAGEPIATFRVENTNGKLPILAVGDFPKLHNLIVRSQEHFQDLPSVPVVLQKFVKEGSNSISLSIKLDDGEGLWKGLNPLPGQVLFDSSTPNQYATNDLLPIDLYREAITAGSSLDLRIDPWFPVFFDRAAIQYNEEWMLEGDPPDKPDQGFVDAREEAVQNYELDLIKEVVSKYPPPDRLYLDHFRFTNNQGDPSNITAFVAAVRDALPASIDLAGYMWLPDTWWSGQDYNALDDHLDVFCPMLYWQESQIATYQEAWTASKQYVLESLNLIESYLGTSFLKEKVTPTFSITSAIAYKDKEYEEGQNDLLDKLSWEKCQLNILGTAADKGIVEYDLFYHGNWFWDDQFSDQAKTKTWIQWARIFASLAEASSDTSKCSAADIDRDGVVNMTEVMSYIAAWKAGSVTIVELMTAIGEWKNGCGEATHPADLNGDGKVNTSDYAVFRGTLGKCRSDTGFIAEADYDGDGCVTYADYRMWYEYFRSQ